MLGLKRLQKWICLLALTTLDNKPQILIVCAMTRAKMCELLGQKITSRKSADEYFTLGLISLMDAFVDLNMNELLDKISLLKTMKNALLRYEGDMGKVLYTVINYENGNWDCEQKIPLIGDKKIQANDITQAYLDSVQWAENNKHI